MRPAAALRLAIVPPLAFAERDFSWLRGRGFGTYQSRCRAVTAAALRAGTLIRAEACEGCGVAADEHRCDERGGIKAHHPDYSDPMLIVWLCGACHNHWHNEFIAAWQALPYQHRSQIARVVGARVEAMNGVAVRGKRHFGLAAAVPL